MSTQWKSIAKLQLKDKTLNSISFDKLESQFNLSRLPYAAKILLENLLRHEDRPFVQEDDILTLAKWDTSSDQDQEISFVPARVVLQDFTGVPAIVDLAAMRDAISSLGGDAQKINPFNPVELVIDHSVMVDHFATEDALKKNTDIEVERNKERYQFLKWGQSAFDNFKVVPPGRGIVHQVNLEYLARCVFEGDFDGEKWAYPDTLVGTDSHTTMINGLGVLGWGVGGIEAEAAMLGQPVTMLIPKVVGFKLSGKLNPGVTATDLVLTITEQLRSHGVVGKFVEFYGKGLSQLSLADRATIANMAPEYGATCGIFPLDKESLNYLNLTGRDSADIDRVEAYAKQLGIWHDHATPEAEYHEQLEFDLASVVPSIAGPKRPQDRIALDEAATAYKDWSALNGADSIDKKAKVTKDGKEFDLKNGSVVIAAITSCTNTSNPSVLVAAGLLARNAAKLGIKSKPWVKTSLAPGSQVVTEYLENAGLMDDLEALGFNLVGYGCTTCIGNSGPLPTEIGDTIRKNDLSVTSVLSGNRNFEGRIHADIAANYLASPPLVVAYAIAGNMNIDITKDAICKDADGNDIYLKDLWPTDKEIKEVVEKSISRSIFTDKYSDVFNGDDSWNELDGGSQSIYQWPDSTYIKQPPFFTDMSKSAKPVEPISDAACLVKVGDSITTDHISPAGTIADDSPAAKYLKEQGITNKDFNSYGSRRGNHEVMMRGTFANVRLQNQLAPGTTGSATTHYPSNKPMSIFDAAMLYQEEQVDTVVLAGKEYGTGSSRDWAAKGPSLLGIKVVMAESYERIHRSNLIGMGILPLQFKPGESADVHGLTGKERFDIPAVEASQKELVVRVKSDKETKEITFDIRIDTANEFDYFSNGGILSYVIRNMLGTLS
ncbi:aconitate hydratase AcnA [Psychrosphaera haliotis]|uniref:Aconitate hydratase n=1 Tax=Psychrosphaera haliotis TaxID=555083 RepID=A0A6N8F6G0_9GAMM|nr:aconitate hydratase AcnA [Psychrosphaera haliotis]MUH71933.1 aconitate hydratase AcnA [Psychrosphaera haliotis]